jgi:biopolymer transport protein ExbB/TolQ
MSISNDKNLNIVKIMKELLIIIPIIILVSFLIVNFIISKKEDDKKEDDKKKEKELEEKFEKIKNIFKKLKENTIKDLEKQYKEFEKDIEKKTRKKDRANFEDKNMIQEDIDDLRKQLTIIQKKKREVDDIFAYNDLSF